jgi:protein-tyrosine-phosphatase
MGEAVLQNVAKQRGLDVHVSSCGTADYHVGEEPDERQWSARWQRASFVR